MQDLITIKEAAKILDVSLSTVSYYVRTKKLAAVASDQRTAHRKHRQLIDRADVERLSASRTAPLTAPAPN
jgi:excisionase family DNA binding protein